MSEYQRGCPRVDQRYGDHAVVRAPYAHEGTTNDAPVHNSMPNAVPQFHMSCYERPADIRSPPNTVAPWVPVPGGEKPAVVTTERKQQASPTQAWMTWKDSKQCNPRNEAMSAVKQSSHNNSHNVGSIITGQPHHPTHGRDRPDDKAHVSHAAPPQAWATGYDSSLSRRRNFDSETMGATPRGTTSAQGMLSPRHNEPMSPTTAGQEHGGQTKKCHSSPMGHQGWATSWDSSLCRKWEGKSGGDSVGALIHGGA